MGFLISAIFLFSGAVNQSALDIYPALPFLYYLLFSPLNKKFKKASRLIIIICSVLFFLKLSYSPLFWPANGRIVVLKNDACYRKINQEGVLWTDYKVNGKRAEYEIYPLDQSEICKLKVLKDSEFKIIKPVVTGIIRNEYNAVAVSSLGTTVIYSHTLYSEVSLFKWKDGSEIKVTDFYRTFFWMSSFFMLFFVWPFGYGAIFLIHKSTSP